MDIRTWKNKISGLSPDDRWAALKFAIFSNGHVTTVPDEYVGSKEEGISKPSRLYENCVANIGIWLRRHMLLEAKDRIAF